MIKSLGLFCLAIFLSGCYSFITVKPGNSSFSGLTVRNENAWNQAPNAILGRYRTDTIIWTQNGMQLDRIMIIPAVSSGEPIFRQLSRSQALPTFDSNMLPNEIQELTESSLLKLYGEGKASVEASKLRPNRFGSHKGFMFDLDVIVSEGANYKGLAGAMIIDDKLYLIVYLAAVPYYYERYLDEATEIINSATFVEVTS